MAFITPTFSSPPAPPCPKCKVPLEGIGDGRGEGTCGTCAIPLQFLFFPARHRTKPVARAVASTDGDATCFFHTQNRAASVCESCGRYLCLVCEVPGEKGERLCPPCISSGRKKTVAKADELVVYDSIALSLALLPIFLWPVTLVTAPAALFLAIYGWKKPRSLIRPGSSRFVVAIIVATLEIGGWTAGGIAFWLS